MSNAKMAAGANTSASTNDLGTGASAASPEDVHLSAAAFITTTDTLLTTVTAPGQAAVGQPSYHDMQNVTVTLAASLAPGAYYFSGMTDYIGQMPESDQSNNDCSAAAITVTDWLLH